GGLVRHIIENNLFFRDYVVHFTNASCILREDFRDTEEGATGFFSGWSGEQCGYDRKTWLYGGDRGLSFPERDLTLQHPRCVRSGGLVRHIIENNLFFRDYVVHFTNASCILREDFRDTEEGATGFFSGWSGEQCGYDRKTWLYGGDRGLSFPERDLTLQHPRCVLQTLRRHFA